MLSELRYDSEMDVIRVTIIQTLTHDDLRDALKGIAGSSEHRADVNAIWDLRKVQFSNVDIDLIFRMKDVRAEFAARRNVSRAAIIVSGNIESALIKLFSHIAETPDDHIRIVETLEEAEAWCTKGR